MAIFPLDVVVIIIVVSLSIVISKLGKGRNAKRPFKVEENPMYGTYGVFEDQSDYDTFQDTNDYYQ